MNNLCDQGITELLLEKSGLSNSWATERWKLFNIADSTIPSQEKTGYCWLIASLFCLENDFKLNTLKPDLSVLFYEDKWRKVKRFLEESAAYIKRPMSDEKNRLLYKGISDRGQWQLLVDLVKRQGIPVIQSEQKTLYAIKRTAELNSVINGILRYYWCHIRTNYISEENKLSLKKNVSEHINDLLKKCYEIEEHIIGERIDVSAELNEMVSITGFEQRDNPDQKILSNTEYIITTDKCNSIQDHYGDFSFYNVAPSSFEDAVNRQIHDYGKCLLGCDSGKFRLTEWNIYDDSFFDFSELIGDAFVDEIKRKESLEYYGAGVNHMLVAVDYVETEEGTWYLCMDTSESAKKTGGYVLLSPTWFIHFVFQAIVNRKYISKDWDNRIIKRVLPSEYFHFDR